MTALRTAAALRAVGTLTNWQLQALLSRFTLSAFEAEIGDKVQVPTDTFHTTAKVIWGNSHYLGVRFRHPLSRDQVKRSVAASKAHAPRRSPVSEAVEA